MKNTLKYKFWLLLGLSLLLTGIEKEAGAQEGVARHRLDAPARTHWADKGRLRADRTIRGSMARRSVSVIDGSNILSGVMKQVLVPVSFADEPFTYDRAEVEDLYYGAGSADRYSMTSFYTEASRGVFTVNGTVVAPVLLPRTRAAYIGTRNQDRFAGVADSLDIFIKDVLTALDSTFDFGPHADQVGSQKKLAALVIVQPHQGGECLSQTDGGVWAHRYNMTELLGAPYKADSTDSDGPVLVDDYILQSAEECGVAGVLGGAGTAIHETGHLIGLPDLYNTDGQKDENPAGLWDLMGSGNYHTLNTPAQLGAWSRWVLGWTSPRQVNIPESGNIAESVTSSIQTGQVILIPFKDTPEFLMLEARSKTGSDAALPEEGLLIWRIDPRIANEEGIRNNSLNNNPSSVGVELVQADGQKDLNLGVNQGDASDPWPGSLSKTEYGANTSPSWRSSQGFVQGRIGQIAYSAGTATFVLSNEAGEEAVGQIVPDTLPHGIAGGEYPKTVIKIVLPNPETWQVTWSVDSLALAKLGLVLRAPIQGEAEMALGDKALILSGRLVDSATTTSFSVEANITGSSSGVSQSITQVYQLVIIGNPELGLSRLAAALLDPSAPLTGDQIKFYDTNGNKNNKFDLGDIILGLKSGLITWESGTIIPKP